MRKIDFYIYGMRLFHWLLQSVVFSRGIYFVCGFIDGVTTYIQRVRQTISVDNDNV